MKCYCCDKILSTQEATRKFKSSNTFVDMCTKCLSTIEDEVLYTEGFCEDDKDTLEDLK